MTRKVCTALSLMLLIAAAPACAQSQVRHIGGEGPNAVLADAVIVDDMIYLSGVLGTRAGPGVQEQTQQVMETIRSTLAEHGATMDDIVKCTVYMADLSERPLLNEVYRSFFTDNRPARSAVGVDLGGARVEIECMAVIPER